MGLYAWVEDGVLAATEDPLNIPEKYRSVAVEFPGLTIMDTHRLALRDGKPVLRGEEELRQEKLKWILAQLRAERDRRLTATDWVVVRAVERGEPVPEAWRAYRQALRDLPQTVSEEALLSGEIPWPKEPERG